MKERSIVLCSFGGDGFHLPGHSVEACITAHVEGADLIRLTVQTSADGVPVLYPHADLSATTDGSGSVSSHCWGDLRGLDAGHAFQLGEDHPWRIWRIEGRQRPKRHHRLTRLSTLINTLEAEVTYALQLTGPASLSDEALRELARQCLALLDGIGANGVILCTDRVEQLATLRGLSTAVGLVVEEAGALPTAIGKLNADYCFLPWTVFDDLEGSVKTSITEKLRLVLGLDPDPDAETVEAASEVAFGIESESMMNLGPLLEGSRVRFLDEFKGTTIDRDHWVAGVSSGYTNMHRAAFRGIDDRGRCEVKVVQNDGLLIDVAEGYQYASGAVVTLFSVGGRFAAEVDFKYENPQNATEMVMCALNSTVYPIHHREGELTHVTVEDEHPAFDAHGLCPYVSVEREEDDGNRIMHNQSHSELFNLRPTNFYRHDVGAGDSKDVALRLARRGRFFVGHYKDEKNPRWVGLGYVENNSMNERVFFRLSGKHYPKSSAPDPLPWNRFLFTRFCIRQPRA